jgi:hypothetical protein
MYLNTSIEIDAKRTEQLKKVDWESMYSDAARVVGAHEPLYEALLRLVKYEYQRKSDDSHIALHDDAH